MADRERRAIINSGSAGHADMQRQIAAARRFIPAGRTLQEYAARRPEVVRAGVEKIIRRLDGTDAFDVLELLRLREVIGAQMGVVEDVPQNPRTVEIVALALLARGRRYVGDPDAPQDRAQKATEMLHLVGAEIGGIGSFSALADSDSRDAWARLAARYRLTRINVRSMHYREVDDQMNRRLFGSGDFATALDARVGFSLDEFEAVRDAVRKRYSRNLFGAFDELDAIMKRFPGSSRGGPDPDEEHVRRGRELLESVMVQPGNRASFTAGDIAAGAQVEEDVAQRILDLFAVPFEERDAIDAVDGYLDGVNPFASAALIRDADGNYLQLVGDIGDDSYRQIIERGPARYDLRQLYNGHRRVVSEATAGSHLRRILGHGSLISEGYHYLAPKTGHTVAELGKTAAKPTVVGKDCEGDLLFVLDDVAIVVEVKAASFSLAARSTRDDYFRNEVTKTIGAGAEQARRAAELIRANGGLWQPGGSWLDLSGIREVRTIVVTLEDLGTLSTSAADLNEAGVMPLTDPSWIVNAYDLAVIAELLDDPVKFLLYLRRRTDPDTAARWKALDELDLVMYFLQSLLEHQPDPDRVRRDYPNAPDPGDDAGYLWEDQPTDAQVGVYTGPLDQWWDGRFDRAERTAKPGLELDPSRERLITTVARSRVKGSIVAAADVLGLTVAQRSQLDQVIADLAVAAERGLPSAARISLAGSSGAGAIVLRSAPSNARRADLEAALSADFEEVMRDWGADRAVALAIGERGRPVSVGYSSNAAPAVFAHYSSAVPPAPRQKHGKGRSKRR